MISGKDYSDSENMNELGHTFQYEQALMIFLS